MVEKLAEVNERGEYTGRVLSREDIHENELLHPVVVVWIVNTKGEVLLQQRSETKKMYKGVLHISTGGHIEQFDKPLPSAVREVSEEIGLSTDENDYLSLGVEVVQQKIPETGKRDKEFVHSYLLLMDSKNLELKLQEDEVASVLWKDLEEMEAEIKNDETYVNYLNHPKWYYLETISKIKSTIK